MWGRGLKDGYKVNNISTCANHTDANFYAKAFTYSPSRRWCKLLAYPNPDSGKHGDAIFCQKLGRSHTFYSGCSLGIVF